jgi:hypothetical protein
MMNFSGKTLRRQAAGCGLFAGLAAAVIAAPTASAAPDCSAAGVASTVSSVTGSANQYLSAHPDANAAQRQCNTTGLSPDLQSAYNEFMAG